MTTRLLPVAAAAIALTGPAWAAGRSAADICVNAGYRAGTVAFQACMTRVSGDDPLQALEEAGKSDHAAVDGKDRDDRAKPKLGLVTGRYKDHDPAMPELREDEARAAVGLQLGANVQANGASFSTQAPAAVPAAGPVSAPPANPFMPALVPPTPPEPPRMTMPTMGWSWGGQ
jgi:hypothetical protein